MLRAVVLALALVAGCLADDAADEVGHLPEEPMKGIVEITSENVDKLVNGAKPAFIEFFAPWCGHCRSMAPEIKKLGELMEANPDIQERIVVGKLNADEHPKIGKRLHVAGYPTLRFFPRGKVPGLAHSKDYSGERTTEALFAYIKRKLASEKDVARVEALDDLAAKIGKAAAKEATKLVAELEAAAAKLEGDAKAHGEVYVKLAKKGVEKGAAWFGTERARLERMISSGAVAPSKMEPMTLKSSALGAFLGEAREGKAGDDADEEAPDETAPYEEPEDEDEEDDGWRNEEEKEKDDKEAGEDKKEE